MTAARPPASSPLFGDVLALSHPGTLEVVAELVPQHEHVTGSHFLLSRFCLHAKVAHCVLETVVEEGEEEVNTRSKAYHGKNFFTDTRHSDV